MRPARPPAGTPQINPPRALPASPSLPAKAGPDWTPVARPTAIARSNFCITSLPLSLILGPDSLKPGNEIGQDRVEHLGPFEIDGMASTHHDMDRCGGPQRRDFEVSRRRRDDVGVTVEELDRHFRRQPRDCGLDVARPPPAPRLAKTGGADGPHGPDNPPPHGGR